MSAKEITVAGLLLAGALLVPGCGPGDRYDDPGSTTVSRHWSDTDIRMMASELVQKLAAHPVVAGAKKPPVILPGRIHNRAHRHLNTRILMSRIETALLDTGKVAFVDAGARPKLLKEYEYMASGKVDPKTQKGPGKQTGCNYLLWGSLENVPAAQGKKYKIDYFYVKLKLTDVSTGLIRWKGEAEIKKRIRK